LSEAARAPAEQAQRLLRHRVRGGALVRWLESLRTRNTFLVAGVASLALVIRLWNFGSLGFEHWDEFYFVSDAQTVSQHWPAGFRSIGWVTAPLVAYTDGTLFHFLGGSNWIPFAVSAAYGTLACIALYFLGSRLFGAAVGLIAATILATSDYSAMFSRMALADATFDFWLITSVLFIWLGFERKRLIYYMVAGISAGLLLNTKYNGVFPLVFAASWLGGEFLLEAFTHSRALRQLAAEYRMRLIGTAIIGALAIMLFVPFFLKVAHYPGWHFVLTYDSTFGAHTVIKTPPTFILWYFWLFSSPPTVLLAFAGIAIGIVRFTRPDRFMLIYTAGWFVALMVFAPYPREGLSLMPAVAIWAARAIVQLWRLAQNVRLRPVAMAAAPICLIAIVIAQAVPLSHMLSLRTQGYADAGAAAARYQSGGDRIWTRTQAVASLYLHDEYFLDASPIVISLLSEQTTNVVLVTDQTLSWYPKIDEFFRLNRDRLRVIDRVPNPLYDEVFLQPATAYGLAHINDPPDAYRYITFWRVTAPLAFPADWPH
jgi:4-amino-4-deoxy-L-arabinose transferase-like glycosyltransferase